MRAGSATPPGRRCTKLSSIESPLQYRFATPKPLKARPGPGGCRIARLCNPLSLALHCVGSVLAVKGTLRALDGLRADPKDALFMREKGDFGPCSGPKGTFRPYWTP